MVLRSILLIAVIKLLIMSGLKIIQVAYILSLFLSVKGFQAIGNTQYVIAGLSRTFGFHLTKQILLRVRTEKALTHFGEDTWQAIFVFFKITSPFSDNKIL